ncbi:MAG: DNA repair protein RecO [Saprospiraceae bacterium]|nr:DNA repair protein RecO [Saprospiraceae bacterium]
MLKTEGIVFRITRFKESSLILDIYTEAQGLQSFIANGVFSKSSQRLASILQLMNLVDLLVYFNENKEIHRIKEVNPSILYQRIPFDIRRSAIGTFILEVCRKSIKGHQANPELFQFIKNSFIQLDQTEILDPFLHFNFLLEFSNFLGFNPLDNYSKNNDAFDLINGSFVPYERNSLHIINPKDSALLIQLFRKQTPQEFIKHIEDKRRILDILILYYKHHIDQFKDIKSIEVFKGIF